MSAEGVSISTIARVLHRAWNTIDRWLRRTRVACRKFLDRRLRGYTIRELQADEIKPFVDLRKSKIWIMADIEVGTRLWPTTRVGKRSYKNIRQVLRDTFNRGLSEGRVLITTDGYKPYAWVIKRMFGPTCLYGQIIKKWKNNRVTKVIRKIVIGEPWQIKHALECSEDSEKLNTSFIERLNLTIRRNTAYLHRQTPVHARCDEALEAQLELQRCYYNFMRPHMALKFGSEVWTPAMMAGIAKHKLTWRDVLSCNLIAVIFFLESVKVFIKTGYR
jgi:IS1 family transposase